MDLAQYGSYIPNAHSIANDGANVASEPLLKLNAVESFKSNLSPSDASNTMAGAMTGNPYLAGAGLAVDLVGKGTQIYGQYKAREAAEEAAEQAQKRYEAELKRMKELDAKREDQQRRANEMAYGQYAMGIEERAQKNYGTY